MIRLAAVLVLAVASAAAAQPAPPAPVDGDPAALDRFAGEWVGSYASSGTGRHGSLVFRLAAGADSARAVVLMTPRSTETDPAPTAVPLVVRHIEVAGESLRGTLARYDDPEWELPLDTSFGATLTDDGRLEGAFRAAGVQVDTVPQVGQWWATRVADPPVADL